MKRFRQDLHCFRAFAIIMIVAGHALGDWQEANVLGFMKTFLLGGTALFVFISGVFFNYLTGDDFSYEKYIKKKFQNIIMPYAVVTTVFFLYLYVIRDFNPDYYEDNLLVSYVVELLMGKVFIQFWYIPFALLLFLTAPLFLHFRSISRNYQIPVLLVWFALSMFMHRPDFTLNPFMFIHAYLYYVPFYMLGIVYDQNSEKLESRLNRKLLPLLSLLFFSLSLCIVYFQVFKTNHIGNYHKYLFSFEGIDLTVPAKITLILSLLFLAQLFDKGEIRLLRLIGDTSFAIFFLHVFFLNQFNNYIIPYSGSPLHDMVLLFVRTIIAVALSVCTACFIKYFLGRKSRYVIGY
ncbi:MAG: acyltransferase [Spirochaetales bacterium]|nr:acyltransferase [Spirochaetales bacterium]